MLVQIDIYSDKDLVHMLYCMSLITICFSTHHDLKKLLSRDGCRALKQLTAKEFVHIMSSTFGPSKQVFVMF